MPSTGSIIQLHHHNNFELLEFLTENNNNLYYKDKPIYTPISQEPNNGILTKPDGFYIKGDTILTDDKYDTLTKFTYTNGLLCYDGLTVSREYERPVIQLMINQLWTAINTGGTV